MRGYVICTTPRSGSNFLCQLLESTGKLGRPREYFNGPARRTLDDPNFPLAPAAQVDRILRDGASVNGVYALKAFADQWRGAAAAAPLTAVLPALRFVRLARRDILGQAISWSIALHTQQYRSTQRAVAAPVYDGNLILQCLHNIAALQADWSVFFARTGIGALDLVYEDVARAPDRAVALVANWMDVDDAQINWRGVDVCVQRNELNETWRERFLAEHGAPDAVYPAAFRSSATT